MRINKAFTLAEVLITLVIIGVIAAITIPVLTANYRREEASSRIKKFYSTLGQAATKAKSEGKNWEYFLEDDSLSTDIELRKTFVDEYVLPYLSYGSSYLVGGGTYRVILNDGTYFDITGGSCVDFQIDINGAKRPNAAGRDKFRLLYCPSSSSSWIQTETIIPYCAKTTDTREKAMTLCKSTPLSCSCLLSYDNWEFKKDYPWGI